MREDLSETDKNAEKGKGWEGKGKTRMIVKFYRCSILKGEGSDGKIFRVRLDSGIWREGENCDGIELKT